MTHVADSCALSSITYYSIPLHFQILDPPIPQVLGQESNFYLWLLTLCQSTTDDSLLYNLRRTG